MGVSVAARTLTCVDTTLQDPLVGQVLDGRYRVDARIAVGGMATVYRAVDTRLDRVLALKVMHPALAADAAFVERFIREAKSVARLAHPNVVAVFDQGTDGSYVYLAMEYVAGCTLRDVLRERGALQPRAALDILEPVLAALGAAHRAGFVHRDMKPENVLIGDDGRVKVADFGLVRAVDTVTNTTGTVLGTVSYLAPEQIEHGTTDTRVDVYACGVVALRDAHRRQAARRGLPRAGALPAPARGRAAAVGRRARAAVELDELVARRHRPQPRAAPVRRRGAARRRPGRHGRALSDRAAGRGAAAGASPAAHDNAEDRTSVIPRSLSVPRPVATGPDPLNRTSRLESPAARRPGAPVPASARRPGVGCWRGRRRRAARPRGGRGRLVHQLRASSPRSRPCCGKTEAKATRAA